jgi:Toprim-like
VAMPGERQKRLLWGAAQAYRKSLPGSPGQEYLEGRGLWSPQLASLGIGYVANPHESHEHYRGWLSIPYLRWSPRAKWTCVSIRFRCIRDHDHAAHNHGKYLSSEGDSPHLYNARALLDDRPDIGMAEGEFDTQAVMLGGLPCVGIPGVKAWEKHWWDAFEGYENVYLFVDGDEAGREFAHKVVKRALTNVHCIYADEGEDANSMKQKYGADWFHERMVKRDS